MRERGKRQDRLNEVRKKRVYLVPFMNHSSPFSQCSSRVSCSSGDRLTLALSTSASTSCPSNSPTTSSGTSPSFCEIFHWRAVISSGSVSLTVFPSFTRQMQSVSLSAPATQVWLDCGEENWLTRTQDYCIVLNVSAKIFWHTTCSVRVCSEFAKLFQRTFQKSLFAKI